MKLKEICRNSQIHPPFNYLGGKSKNAKKIIEFFPRGQTTLVDVFGGGGNVLLGCPTSLFKREVYNDVDRCLVAFWKSVVTDRNTLVSYIKSIPISRSLFYEFRELIQNDGLTELNYAIYYYYLITLAYASRQPSDGKCVFSPKREIKDSGCGWQVHRYNWDKLYNRIKNVIIECLHFRDVIRKYDDINTLFYCDPPYYITLKEGNYYSNILTLEEHIELKDKLVGMKGKFVLSYDNLPEIRELYKDCYMDTMKFSYTASSKSPPKDVFELIITNFEPEIYQGRLKF